DAPEGQGIPAQVFGVVTIVDQSPHLQGDQVGPGQPHPNQHQGPRKYPQQRGWAQQQSGQCQQGQHQICQSAPQVVQAVGGIFLGGGRHQALSPGTGDVVGAQLPSAVQLYQQHSADAKGQHPVAGEQAAHQMSPLV